MSSRPLLLSILVCAVPERMQSLGALVDSLRPQIDAEPVELLVHMDNRIRTIGQKRNDLMQSARGRYLAFVDDDDRVGDDYVRSLLMGIRKNPDCVTFEVEYTNQYDGFRTIVEYRRHIVDNVVPRPVNWHFHRSPNHIMCILADIARRLPFPVVNREEDYNWAIGIDKFLETEEHIPKVLYYYDDARDKEPMGQRHLFAAEYGAPGQGHMPLTTLAGRAFRDPSRGGCEVPMGFRLNSLAGDPIPNIPKQLRLHHGVDVVEISELELSHTHVYQESGHVPFLRFTYTGDAGDAGDKRLLVDGEETDLPYGSWRDLSAVRLWLRAALKVSGKTCVVLVCAHRPGLQKLVFHVFHDPDFLHWYMPTCSDDQVADDVSPRLYIGLSSPDILASVAVVAPPRKGDFLLYPLGAPGSAPGLPTPPSLQHLSFVTFGSEA